MNDTSQIIRQPTVIAAAGNKPKKIEEFIGRLNSGTEAVSIARMNSPAGWQEPGQQPEFDEYTVVLHGTLVVETRDGIQQIGANEAFVAPRGQWIRYRTPEPTDYIAVCLPAFSPESVHRDR